MTNIKNLLLTCLMLIALGCQTQDELQDFQPVDNSIESSIDGLKSAPGTPIQTIVSILVEYLPGTTEAEKQLQRAHYAVDLGPILVSACSKANNSEVWVISYIKEEEFKTLVFSNPDYVQQSAGDAEVPVRWGQGETFWRALFNYDTDCQ